MKSRGVSEVGVRRCVRCVMNDASDETIEFDQEGFCNYCTDALSRPEGQWSEREKEEQLVELISKMKDEGKGSQYDCIMGLSGGLDSSYLALMGYRWGLRVLAVHIDDGFDSEITKENIRKLVGATGFDYLTVRPDPVQFAELTKAFMRAGVPNLAAPQDNVLFAFLHQMAKQFGIRYFASGGNFALESVLQRGNTHDVYDMTNLKDIWRKFGSGRIDRLALMSSYDRQVDRYVRGLRSVRPLNYIDYRRDRALEELAAFCGFHYYGSKHLENRLTEFIQLYWFPEKFGVDKRTSHLSSMIVSGQMTRDEAIDLLNGPIYDEVQMESCIEMVQERLGISQAEFGVIMGAPAKQHTDYAVQDRTLLYRLAGGLRRQALKFREIVRSRG